MSNKGGPFEREVCKKLSLWWTAGERDDIFWRTHGSGARATSRSKQGKTTAGQYGDICATDPIGQLLMDMLLLELKRGYSREGSIQDLLDMKDPRKTFIFKTIEKTIATWKAARTDPIGPPYFWGLIWKRDRRESLIILPESFRPEALHGRHHITVSGKYLRIRIYLLTDFLTEEMVEELMDELKTAPLPTKRKRT